MVDDRIEFQDKIFDAMKRAGAQEVAIVPLPVGTKVRRVNQGDKVADDSWGEGTIVSIPEIGIADIARICVFSNTWLEKVMMYIEELEEVE